MPAEALRGSGGSSRALRFRGPRGCGFERARGSRPRPPGAERAPALARLGQAGRGWDAGRYRLGGPGGARDVQARRGRVAGTPQGAKRREPGRPAG